MQDADRRTVNIANTIIQLKDDLNDLQQKHVCSNRRLGIFKKIKKPLIKLRLKFVETRKYDSKRRGNVQCKKTIGGTIG